MEVLHPFVASFIGNSVVAVSIVIILFILRLFTKRLQNSLDFITALTVGLLLGIVILWFLPELAESGIEMQELGFFLLAWIGLFYILELFLHWHHCKDLTSSQEAHKHEHTHSHLIFAGTFFHNFFHGIEIFAAFAIDYRLGVWVTTAILLHSIPQNVVNFVMNHNNMKSVYIAGFAGVLWSLCTYPFADFLVSHKFHMLALIAGGLLYTALADIFPSFKSKWNLKNKLSYLVFVILGIGVFFTFSDLSGHTHDHHQNETPHLESNHE